MSTKKKNPAKKAAKAKQNGKLGPVAQVWQIATKLGAKAERKDVLDACVQAGVNKFTAATQYHRWKHATAAERNGKTKALPAEPKEKEPASAK